MVDKSNVSKHSKHCLKVYIGKKSKYNKALGVLLKTPLQEFDGNENSMVIWEYYHRSYHLLELSYRNEETYDKIIKYLSDNLFEIFLKDGVTFTVYIKKCGGD